MNKPVIYQMLTGILLVFGLSACAVEKADTISVPASITQEVSKELPEETVLETTGSETILETESPKLSPMFSSDDETLTMKSVNMIGPMVRELVIENAEKVYPKTILEEVPFPRVEYSKDSLVSNAGIWTNQQEVCISFWNIENKNTIDFFIDGQACSLTFPEIPFDEVEVHKEFERNGTAFSVESLSVYPDAVVLNCNVKNAKTGSLTGITLKTKNEENAAPIADIDLEKGTVKLLYLFENYAGDLAKEVQGIVVDGQSIPLTGNGV